MIYLDNAATTPVFPEVVTTISDTLTHQYGNPSAIYQIGKTAKRQLTNARQIIAKSLNVNPADVYFTSGATESNNWALSHLAKQSQGQGNHIVTTAIEHPSVHEVMQQLETIGFEVTYLEPDSEGTYTVDQFLSVSTQQTIGWSVMAVNNEVGSILPIEELAMAAKQQDYWIHVDSVQAIGHGIFDFGALPVTSFVGSAHKFNGPKGMGFLVFQSTDKKNALKPLLHGGGQESNQRSGTENLPYILGMATALELTNNYRKDRVSHDTELSEYLYQSLDQAEIDYHRNGPVDSSKLVDYIHSLWFPGQLASQLLIKADLNQIALSAGSACSAGSVQPSRILKAYYPNTPERWIQSIRISFGWDTTKEDVDALIQLLIKEL
ncbi:cysteine desulfurase [Aerococcaceae bacterium DSM 111020]|nr:cysteine desulfurase [Aerococcaceae bacterium DSM 111020]